MIGPAFIRRAPFSGSTPTRRFIRGAFLLGVSCAMAPWVLGMDNRGPQVSDIQTAVVVNPSRGIGESSSTAEQTVGSLMPVDGNMPRLLPPPTNLPSKKPILSSDAQGIIPVVFNRRESSGREQDRGDGGNLRWRNGSELTPVSGESITRVALQPPVPPSNEITPSEAPASPVEPPTVLTPQANGTSGQVWEFDHPANNAIQPGYADFPPAEIGRAVLPFNMRQYTQEITVTMNQQVILEYQAPIAKVAVTNAAICEVVAYAPGEFGILGLSTGTTTVTIWPRDPRFDTSIYLVKVRPDPEVQKRRDEHFLILERLINEEYPNSKIRLVSRGDKLFVKGQARDSREAHEILNIIRNEPRLSQTGANQIAGTFAGTASDPFLEEEAGTRNTRIQVISRLMVPGVQQVALHVKIAELNRTAARRFGVDVEALAEWSNGFFMIQSLLNAGANSGAPSILGSLDADDVSFGIRYLEEHGVVRLLSEPTVVTLSGLPAQFQAGGEFAVPTTVGVAGASAVTTDFRAFGTIVTFLPTVVDKDHIRLFVSPEFSQVNDNLTVTGIPGLNTRSVTTTIDLREGQSMAIAGLLDDSMTADSRGDLPFLARLLGRRNVTRNETELIIIVTPELVHPMDPEEVPPLPGFDVTEPTNCEFFGWGHLEGRPTHEYRSTVWPRLMRRYRSGGPAMINGPFGHGQ